MAKTKSAIVAPVGGTTVVPDVQADGTTASKYRPVDGVVILPVPYERRYVAPGRKPKVDPAHVMRRPMLNTGVGLGMMSTVREIGSTIKNTKSKIPARRRRMKKRGVHHDNVFHRAIGVDIAAEYDRKVREKRDQAVYDSFNVARRAHVRICAGAASDQDYTTWADVRNMLERTKSPLFNELTEFEALHEKTFLGDK